MELITVGGQNFTSYRIPVSGCNLLFISGETGALGCGYFSLEAANKFGHALAIVTGVNSFHDMLSAEVKACSEKAAEMGVTIGMSGAEALIKMN